jgi:2-(1,2-epoxy-1,2-dihydrophenyl)acetyl-CoA isomerase
MTTAPQTDSVLLETISHGVALLVLNRPEKLNALNNELATALNSALERLASNDSVRVVILTGAGRAFCAGGDLASIGEGRQASDAKQLEPLLRSGMAAVLKMRTMPKPVIAAVNGVAAGAGMNVALAADIRIASDEAMFGQNFAKVGLFPDFGGTFFLPQLVGPSIAAEMFYTGEMINAETALRIGVVNRIVSGPQLESEVKALAEKITQGPPIAIRAVKHAIFGRDGKALAHALEDEVEHQLKCYLSDDCREGIQAFFEKRPPRFKGR